MKETNEMVTLQRPVSAGEHYCPSYQRGKRKDGLRASPMANIVERQAESALCV